MPSAFLLPPASATYRRVNKVKSKVMLNSLKRWHPVIVGAFIVLVVACGGGDEESGTPFFEEDAPGRDRLIATASPLPVIDSPGDLPDGLEPIWETFAIIAREYEIGRAHV